MISRKHRFHGSNSLRFVFNKGQTVRGQGLSLRFVQNNRQPTYRAAVVVSKKVSKSAVVRNRIRRRIYEVVRTLEPAGPWDIVFLIYGDDLAKIPAAHLHEQIKTLLSRAHIPFSRD